MTGHLLVTGFGPFPGMPVNPSAILARRLAAHPRLRRLAVSPYVLILPTAYAAIATHLEPALAARPCAILMIGVAARARRVRVESRAVNRASRLFPDASGRVSARLCLEPMGPAARTSPVAAFVLRRLRERGVAAIASRNAGRYLCNATYFRALHAGCPVVFLHVPPQRRDRSADRLVDALADVALALVGRARVASALP
ncbi:peptidase C15 [Methylobacterium sp. Leaf108]|uniref:pyroglutamyl-peptidase I family protein n=1 Tax=Methylobacterium sp. Leaf108 TaxID=1736256 RepID=UPI000AF379A8|nr:peptidase C15 [Methylobacterium sp. Leaf108]